MRRLISRREVVFFREPDKARITSRVIKDSRSASPVPAGGAPGSEADALRLQILNNPDGLAAASTFTAMLTMEVEGEGGASFSPESAASVLLEPPLKRALSPTVAKRGRRSLTSTALGTLKGRLTYAKMRRDNLQGELEAMHTLIATDCH